MTLLMETCMMRSSLAVDEKGIERIPVRHHHPPRNATGALLPPVSRLSLEGRGLFRQKRESPSLAQCHIVDVNSNCMLAT